MDGISLYAEYFHSICSSVSMFRRITSFSVLGIMSAFTDADNSDNISTYDRSAFSDIYILLCMVVRVESNAIYMKFNTVFMLGQSSVKNFALILFLMAYKRR